MPARVGPTRQMELLTLAERTALPDRCQEIWYRLVGDLIRASGPATALDVGAGTGYGLAILAAGGATQTHGIDLLPAGPGVVRTDISDVPDASWDWVVPMDVIEHVHDDQAFFRHLLRVARHHVFISTPNWDHFHAQNEFHMREYTPAEIGALAAGHRHRFWGMFQPGGTLTVEPIRTPSDGNPFNFGLLITKETSGAT